MTTVKISEKGQITLPAAARKQLGLNPSSLAEIEVLDGALMIRPLRSIRDVRGSLARFVTGGYVDWETARSETEKIVARQVALDE
jgi:AbrB family looped-hinge helix DNA binding protein